MINIIRFFKKLSVYNYNNKIKYNLNILDKSAKHIMKIGLSFCSILGTIALLILITYNLSFTSPIVFSIGFILLNLTRAFWKKKENST